MQTRLMDLLPEISAENFASPERRLIAKRDAITFEEKSTRQQLRYVALEASKDKLLYAAKKHESSKEKMIILPGMSKRLSEMREQENRAEKMNQNKVFFEASKLYALLAGHPEVFKSLTSSEASLAQSGMKTKAASLKAQDVGKTKLSTGESPTDVLARALKKATTTSRSSEEIEKETKDCHEVESQSKAASFINKLFSGPKR